MRKLLDNDAVAVDDSFFLAGGHSLLGMQLLMRLREEFGADLSLRELFEAPTVERLAVVVASILEKKRLAAIWADLFGTEQVGPDDNFFELGGNPVLVAALQQRIAMEFGKRVSIAELVENPTVRQQAELTQRRVEEKPMLPPGVLALHPSGNGNGIFWLHYLSIDLAKQFGEDQPFFSVALTTEDIASLGESPTLQSIAACQLRKILVTQPQGPYTIGGLCLGGVLAYEIASQLRAAGHAVSLLVLLDPPNPTYVESCDSLARKVRYLGYVVRRAARLGVRTSMLYFREHLLGHFARLAGTKPARTETIIAQELSEAAMFKYQPGKYDGNVLLLLAAESPPHVNYLPGWQAVVNGNLHVQYVNAHHRDLLKASNVQTVAEAIAYHRMRSTDQRMSRLAKRPGATLVQAANLSSEYTESVGDGNRVR